MTFVLSVFLHRVGSPDMDQHCHHLFMSHKVTRGLSAHMSLQPASVELSAVKAP